MDAAGSPSPANGARPVKVFISYSQDDVAHCARVRDLADRLNSRGDIECILDQDNPFPDTKWSIWCPEQARLADFVLVVASQSYQQKVRRELGAERGLGVICEWNYIVQSLYKAGMRNKKYLPILFSKDDENFIPDQLDGYTYCNLEGNRDFDKLIGRITGAALSPVPGAGASAAFSQKKHPFRVPHFSNPFFTGRAAELAAIDAALKAEGRAAISQVQAVCGLGGVGKTQTAVHYCYDHREDYAAVFWLRAETPETLAADVTAMARELSLPEADAKDQAVTVEAVRRWLRENAGWLLVLDNVDSPEMVVACQSFLPTDASGAVLVTTRLDDLSDLGVTAPVDMPTLPPHEALAFLRKRCRRESMWPEEEQAAGDLVHALGCLPLALEQAAAYIVTTKCTFAEYLKAFGAAGLQLLQKGTVKAGDYKHTVATTWTMSIERVQAECPAAVELLQLCSLLAPEAIPLALVRDEGKEMGGAVAAFLAAAGELGAKELLAPLVKYSLIKLDVERDAFSTHRLIQLIIREKTDGIIFLDLTQKMLKVLNKIFPMPELNNWNACERLTPHAITCATLTDKHNLLLEERGNILYKVGNYLSQRAASKASEDIYEKSLYILEMIYGENNLNIAPILSNLATAKRKIGKFYEAESIYLRVLKIREQHLAQNDTGIALSLNNLAGLYADQSRFDEAETTYRRALSIERQGGLTRLHYVAIILNNLAGVLLELGKHDEAMQYYNESLEIRKDEPKNNGLPEATCLSNIACALFKKGKRGEAAALLRQVLHTFQQTLGHDHPETAAALNNLSTVLKHIKSDDEAEKRAREALLIQHKVLGDANPDTILTLDNLADILQKTGREAEAQQLVARAEAGRKTLEALNIRKDDDA